jgi:exopolysaccharide biosynthesis predicted pyruvyltransferase EpsI
MSASPAAPFQDLVSRLNSRIDEVIGSLLPRGVKCALLDFPNHPNVGDSPIWQGERAFLRRAGVAVVYMCDGMTYSESELAVRLGGGIILLHGGGNLGDIWGARQEWRERVIAAFPRNKIVQLPQTIVFRTRRTRTGRGRCSTTTRT